jgi:hypothetical protein
MPVVYFTQMMGLAFGMDPAELRFEEGVVPTKPMLEKWRTPAPSVKKRRMRDKRELPMPQPLPD